MTESQNWSPAGRRDYPFDPSPVHAWLNACGLQGKPVDEIVDGFCQRLVHAGLPLARGYAGMATLHPLVRAYSYTWERRVNRLGAQTVTHIEAETSNFVNSPFHRMLESQTPVLRRRLDREEAAPEFPVLVEFRKSGLTDWLGLLHSFGWLAPSLSSRQLGMISSWATDRPGGFTDAELLLLQELVAGLALAVKAATSYDITRGLLKTYLGSDAAEHVLAGEVRRGQVQEMRAVLFFADLRGFTQIADELGADNLVGLLDDYLDCIGMPVHDNGGQVLKFMGDGLLATFALSGDEAEVCDRALAAARAAQKAVATLNETRAAQSLPVLKLDVALHLGTVMYGNVGTGDRLDFTVVGPAVNEASRIEALCNQVGKPILASDSFKSVAVNAWSGLKSLGIWKLRGVSDAMEIFVVT